MIDVDRADARLLDGVAAVVDTLIEVTDLAADSVLLAGATCRDVLHSALGHRFATARTSDIDLGIAIDDWRAMEQIHHEFHRQKLGTNNIRYKIAGLAVDVMPFGGVEDPVGLSRPATRSEDLVVFGFSDVHKHAMRLTLPGGRAIRIPHPAGYAALKLRSWIDRSAYGEYKDAADLALVAFWYQESAEIRSQLWDPERELGLLAELGLDDEVGAVALLRRDMNRQLGADARQVLAHLTAKLDRQDLADRFLQPPNAPRRFGSAQRRAFVDQLLG